MERRLLTLRLRGVNYPCFLLPLICSRFSHPPDASANELFLSFSLKLIFVVLPGLGLRSSFFPIEVSGFVKGGFVCDLKHFEGFVRWFSN